MKNRGLIVSAVVLSALVGLLYWSNRHYKPGDDLAAASATPPEPAPQILTLNEADLTKVELKKKGAEQITIARDSHGAWQISAPNQTGVDEAAVSGMLARLSPLNADRLVEEKATNLGRYGLGEPILEINLIDKHNTARKLLIGDDTPTGNAAYVQVAGDPRVFTIAGFAKTSLDKGLNDLRDKRLITAEADKITRLELIAKQQDIEFSRDKQQWQILKPGPLRADGPKVDELVRKLTDAKIDTSTPLEQSAAAARFAAGRVIATARLTTDSGTQQLEVRKDKDDYFAKSSVVEGVYKVVADLGQGLDKKVDEFRSKQLFDFGPSDPAKIEIHDGAKVYYLTKGGEDWWSADGKKFDQGGASALLDSLRGLQATDFAVSGFGAPAMEITVTSSDGKRSEKVVLSQGSKNPLAKREGEPTLYVLDAVAIDKLRKLAGDLKTT